MGLGALPRSEGGGGPKIQNIVDPVHPGQHPRVAALTGNQLNAADGLIPDDVPAIEEQEGLKLEFRPPNTIGYLAMNTQKAPFDDARVRQAMNHAINIPRIVETVLQGHRRGRLQLHASTIPFFNDNIEPLPLRPGRARQLLQEAGVENLDTELWYMPIPRPYMPDGKSIAQVMQQDLQEVGVNAKLVTYEWGTYLERTGQGDHPMCLLGWTGDNGDPDNFLNVSFNSATATQTDAQNVAYYKNPEVDRLLEEGQSSVDEAARERAYFRAQEILHEDAPWVPIAYVEPPIGLQDTVQGFVPNPTSSEAFNPVSFSGGGA